MKIGKLVIKISTVAAWDEPDKVVTPAIVYRKQIIDGIKIIFIGMGWWHYAITLQIGYKILNKNSPSRKAKRIAP